METNGRIKELRKSLKLSQAEFGKRLGVSRDVIKNIDNNLVAAKPLFIEHICNTFNVNIEWLIDGSGEVFNQTKNGLVNEISNQYNLSEYGKEFIELYLDMDEHQRNSVDKFLLSILEAEKKGSQSPVEDSLKNYNGEDQADQKE